MPLSVPLSSVPLSVLLLVPLLVRVSVQLSVNVLVLVSPPLLATIRMMVLVLDLGLGHDATVLQDHAKDRGRRPPNPKSDF